MQTKQLAAFAADLTFDGLPDDVRAHARDCIQDTVGVVIFGARLPWSRIVIDYARRNGGAGKSSILGVPDAAVSAPFAALANGALAHAFEMDSLRKPSTGVHPGGLVPPALAVGEEQGASGKALIAAFVAAMEVTTRIGLATRHSSEEKGFHAPGLTGVFGAAVAAGKLLELDAERLCNALGIAGSLCSGLLEFAKSDSGGMVKRLHLGRAAEGGVLAASLAAGGFEGPGTVLEGDYGFLNAFAEGPAIDRLTENLGSTWETRTICYKRCACHGTAQAPIEALQGLRDEFGFEGRDIERIVVGTSRKVLRNHDIPEPKDRMAAQYSMPFSIALSCYRDPADPESILKVDIEDPEILELSRKIRLEHFDATDAPGQNWACRMAIRLKDGRTVEKTLMDFQGSPTSPMSAEALDAKFRASTRSLGQTSAETLLQGLRALDAAPNLSDLLKSARGA